MDAQAERHPCLIVRQAEGHRFRNGMVAGVLTGGIGLGAGLALSGGRYEYVDAFEFAPKTLKYKGGNYGAYNKKGFT
jgi:hypothetical protein